jgi:hypothetical protein
MSTRSSSTVSGPIHAIAETVMLWIIAVVLLVLWSLAIVSSYLFGGLIHLLLVAAFTLGLVRFIRDRRLVA